LTSQGTKSSAEELEQSLSSPSNMIPSFCKKRLKDKLQQKLIERSMLNRLLVIDPARAQKTRPPTSMEIDVIL
jgi:hypothetical protein